MKTILAPLDFSSATEKVLHAATSLAVDIDGRVVLLHVVQPPLVTSDYGLEMGSVQATIVANEQAARRRLEEFKNRLREHLTAVDTVLGSGPPIPEILEQGHKFKADYIVMGSHGHTALYDLLVGGTTHGILRKAPCPVVIVPPESPLPEDVTHLEP